MLETLHLKNVGPAKEMKLEFAPRLNVITGDNGLGKSFILDCVWFGLTETWGQEINSALTASGMARAIDGASIEIKTMFNKKELSGEYRYSLDEQTWRRVYQNPAGQVLRQYSGSLDLIGRGIVLQSHSNGGFSVFDSARHRSFWDRHNEITANVFTDNEVWHVTQGSEGAIRDVANWQREKEKTLEQFKAVLECLSPSSKDKLELGELVPVRLKDGFDTPTIKMPYGDNVPITQASSGIRKIFALAYMLVWAWRQHQRASQVLKREPEKQLTFLIDEIESHLHPKWQQVIVKALLNVAKALSDELEVQIILTTHSPLVLQSLETVFDSEKDAWFDLDFDTSKKEVVLEKRDYFKRGSLNNWITSEAFDLPSSYTPEAKAVMDEVSDALKHEITLEQAQVLNAKLHNVLGDIDIFWSRWQMALDERGLVL